MTTTERVLYALLLVVAAAAAVLSFDALRGLALLCGFAPWLAWLLPVTIDAGAGAGAVAWLGRRAGPGRRFGRWLALALLATSVAGNALGHALAAYATRPHWGVVVAVSAVAPAVLGAVVHLAVLIQRDQAQRADGGSGGDASQSFPTRRHVSPVVAATPPDQPDTPTPAPTPDPAPIDRVRELVAAGAGRSRVASELDITEAKARTLIGQVRADQGAPVNGKTY